MMDFTNGTCCADVHELNTTYQCSFVQNTNDCYVEDGFVEYTIILYCYFSNKLFSLGIFIMLSWLAFLFIALAVAASDFFCPSLIVIAKVLRMSDNIAGITLLAFGNGAPDVFSAIAAVNNTKDGDNGLVLGALLGAGVFLTTIVVGVIALVRPFKSMERPFLRDIIFYMLTVYVTFYICFKHTITLFESIGFIVGYVVYVLIVVLGRVINQKMKKLSVPISAERQEFFNSSNFLTVISNSINNILNDHNEGINRTDVNSAVNAIDHNEDEPLLSHHEEVITTDNEELLRCARNQSTDPNFNDPAYDIEIDNRQLIEAWHNMHANASNLGKFMQTISPIDVVEWKFATVWQRIYSILKAPAVMLFKLTVPVVDISKPLNNWNKYMHAIHCVATLLFSIFSISPAWALWKVGNVFPVYAFFLIGGFILAILILVTASCDRPPFYHKVFAFLGFLAAVLWIKAIASEIVNILQTLGIVFSISNEILGLTLLAWGNSIGDFISDVSMARRGYPRAGFSACFGGPLFNTLLGIGIPFTYTTLSSPDHTSPITYESIAMVLFVSLAISLLISFIVIPAKKFKLTRLYGAFLVLFYVIFLIVALLVEKNVIVF